jgi:hypothetical protein
VTCFLCGINLPVLQYQWQVAYLESPMRRYSSSGPSHPGLCGIPPAGLERNGLAWRLHVRILGEIRTGNAFEVF